MVDTLANAPTPKSGAGTDGGPLNSKGDSGVIETKTFINVPTSGNGALTGAFQDKLEPKDISVGPAGGSKQAGCDIASAMDSFLGGHNSGYKY
jgi:hypothetical protein